MKERTFNSLFPKYNESWAANVLNMPLNKRNGPDLVNEERAVEIKFKLRYENKYYDKCWRVLEHQLNYQKDYPEFYWGFGFYGLSKEVKDISVKDFSNISKLVKKRELYLIKGDWVNNFPRYHHKGKTDFSEWDHYVLFPRMNSLFPKVISEENVVCRFDFFCFYCSLVGCCYHTF